MKKLFKGIASFLMYLLSKLYTYNFTCKLKLFRNAIYTLWIKNFFGDVGNHSSIDYPCSIQGGGGKHICIGEHTHIESRCILGCWEHYAAQEANGLMVTQQFNPQIEIGDYCSIGEYNHISAINKISIGDGLLTGRYVYIGDNAHGGLSWDESIIAPARRPLQSKGEVRIGNNVWIGDKVTILSGVTIGDNVIIGANSVVNHDIPSNCIAAGIPARIVKTLNK